LLWGSPVLLNLTEKEVCINAHPIQVWCRWEKWEESIS
jgi:hypothetical protein